MAGNPQVAPEPVTIKARLLGSSELAIGSRLLTSRDWSGRKARSLFLLLLGTRGHQLHREQVLDLLWPELDADAGSNALYKALHALRRTLEPDLRTGRSSRCVRTRDDMIGLSDSASIWVDVEQFAQTLARAGIAPAEDQRRHLRNAVEIYRGEFVAEEVYADWPVARREALRADHERATLTLARLDAEAGEPLRTVPYLEALLAQDPAFELVHRSLMQAYLAGGERSLALRQFERCREVLERTYDSDPEPETVRLAASIRQAPDTAQVTVQRVASAARYSTLPGIPTPTIGRKDEIADVARLLSDPAVRLVTITGAGGIGKTRLAVECAAMLKGAFPDGIGFVPMAAIRDPGLLFDTIALTLRIPEAPGRPVSEVVTDYLRSRTSLLVLDNLEQVTAAGPAIADLIAGCPDLTILATSRAPLRIRAERLYPLGVLGLPDPSMAQGSDDLANVESAALFLQSLKALRYDCALTAADVPVIAELCLRLEGLPLAIELAAARAHDLALTDILAQLNQRARIVVLRDGPRDLPARQQTLHDLVLWSYDLLTEPERALFRRLAVFAGGIELDALDAIGGENAVALATALAEKSLVTWTHVEGTRRLTMLETIREVAALLLLESGTDRELRVTHALFYANLVARSELAFAGVDQLAVISRFGRDLDNLRAALTWATSEHAAFPTTALEIIAHSGWFWHSGGHTREGYAWLVSAVKTAPPATSRTHALAAYWLGTFALRLADIPAFEQWARRCSELSNALGDPRVEILARKLESQQMQRESRWDECVRLNTRMLAVAREIDDKPAIMDRLIAIGSAQHFLGQLDDAKGRLDEALQIAQESSNLLYQSKILSFAVGIAYDQGDTARMADLLDESERIALLADDRESLAWTVYHRSGLAEYTGDFGAGATYARRAASLFAEMGALRMGAGAMLTHAAMEARQGLTAQALASFQAVIEAARTMWSIEEFLSCILEVGYLGLPAGQPKHGLTLIAAARTGFRDTGEVLNDNELARFDDHVAATRAALSPAIANRAWAAGEAMTLDEALNLAAEVCAATERESVARCAP